MASLSGDGSFQLLVDGQAVTGKVPVVRTGDWQKWADVTVRGVKLPEGVHSLRLAVWPAAST